MCSLLRYYTSQNGGVFPTFRDSLSASSSGDYLSPKDGVVILHPKLGKKVLFYAAQNLKGVQIPFIQRRKPETTQDIIHLHVSSVNELYILVARNRPVPKTTPRPKIYVI
jgi:hypothetical protein